MLIEEYKAITKGLIEATNRGDFEAAVEVDADDVTLNGQPFGREADLQRVQMMATAFPDGRWFIDDLFGGEDRVTLRWTFRGTHQGELAGMPPTGKQVDFSGVSIYHFANKRLVGFWEAFDRLSLMQQLGAIPA